MGFNSGFRVNRRTHNFDITADLSVSLYSCVHLLCSRFVYHIYIWSLICKWKYQNDFEGYIVAFNLLTIYLISNAVILAIIRIRLLHDTVIGGTDAFRINISYCGIPLKSESWWLYMLWPLNNETNLIPALYEWNCCVYVFPSSK